MNIVLASSDRYGFALEARDAEGPIGMIMVTDRPRGVSIDWIEVAPDHRRTQVATRLYERAAQEACARWQRPLRSGSHRREGAEGFWQKQLEKGRATYLPKEKQFELTCPAPASLSGIQNMKTSTKIALGASAAAGLFWLLSSPKTNTGSTGNFFIIDGKQVPTSAKVQNWYSTGMGFNTGRIRTTTRGVTLHFSGSPAATPRSIYNTLVARNLSVQLALGKDGTFFQYTDLSARCVHAGIANNDFLGIEIAGNGDYTPEQILALEQGLKSILGYYRLPWVVPTRSGEVVTGLLTPDEFKNFRGLVGHYMLDIDKVDPGLDLMRHLGGSTRLVA